MGQEVNIEPSRTPPGVEQMQQVTRCFSMDRGGEDSSGRGEEVCRRADQEANALVAISASDGVKPVSLTEIVQLFSHSVVYQYWVFLL